jgi:hypothetical protein
MQIRFEQIQLDQRHMAQARAGLPAAMDEFLESADGMWTAAGLMTLDWPPPLPIVL